MSEIQNKNKEKIENTPLKAPENAFKQKELFVEPKRLWWIGTIIFLITLGRDFLVSPPNSSSFQDKFSPIGFFLWILLCLGILLWEKSNQSKLKLDDYGLSFIILSLAFIPFWRTEMVVSIFAGVVSVIFLMSYLLSYKKPYIMEGTFLGTIVRFFSMFFHGFAGFKNALSFIKNGSKKNKNRKIILSVLFGLLLSLPWVLVFMALFASADAVFENLISEFFKSFSFELIIRTIKNMIWFIIFGGLFFGYLFNLKNKEKKIKKPTLLGMLETLIILGMVDLIFLSFIAVQFRYFFAGDALINLDGYTYAEYARRGTMELDIASMLAIGLYRILHFFKKEDSPKLQNVFKIFLGILFAEIGIVLFSAYQRLILLENAYGVTSTRIMAHVFMITMGIFLIILYFDELRNKGKHYLLLSCAWATTFVFTIAVINMPAMAVRTNQITHGDAGIDWYYLRSLPDEGIPELIDLIRNDGYMTPDQSIPSNPAEFEKVIAELSCREFEINNFTSADYLNSKIYWRIDQVRAMKAISENTDLWADYPVMINDQKCDSYATDQECLENETFITEGYHPWETFYVELKIFDQEELAERITDLENDSYYLSLNEEDAKEYSERETQYFTRYYCDYNSYRGW